MTLIPSLANIYNFSKFSKIYLVNNTNIICFVNNNIKASFINSIISVDLSLANATINGCVPFHKWPFYM